MKEEIKRLKELIIEIASKVETNLIEASSLLTNYDPSKSYERIKDYEVDALEREIETTCLHLMLSERLFASDMRFVSGAMTMVEDFERLGDHALDLQDFALKLKFTTVDNTNELKALLDYVLNMVSSAIRAYVQSDTELAKKVIDSDDYVDNEYLKMIDNLITQDKDHIISSSTALYSALLYKYLERIADHATNIAEWVIYILTGYYKDAQIV